MEDRIVAARAQDEDAAELSLRPRRLDEYIGQTKVKENLRILLEAAQHVTDSVDPPSDVHASAEFRRKLARYTARQAIELAAQRAEGV